MASRVLRRAEMQVPLWQVASLLLCLLLRCAAAALSVVQKRPKPHLPQHQHYQPLVQVRLQLSLPCQRHVPHCEPCRVRQMRPLLTTSCDGERV